MALDLGDVWIGTALSDALHMFAHPYKTIHIDSLYSFIEETAQMHSVHVVVVGYPLTLRGTESEQTKKVVALFQALKKHFEKLEWVLWEERFSSKWATQYVRGKKDTERRSHSIAAATILETYLGYRSTFCNTEE